MPFDIALFTRRLLRIYKDLCNLETSWPAILFTGDRSNNTLTMLEKERAYYHANLARWLKEHIGRTVLIKNESLVGFFDNEDAAIAEGARLFGNTPFLVRRIQEDKGDVLIPSLTFGILSADNSRPA
jgi:hypothetical protein